MYNKKGVLHPVPYIGVLCILCHLTITLLIVTVLSFNKLKVKGEKGGPHPKNLGKFVKNFVKLSVFVAHRTLWILSFIAVIATSVKVF